MRSKSPGVKSQEVEIQENQEVREKSEDVQEKEDVQEEGSPRVKL
ncbi:hypothetical protein PF003_g37461 [Phytophthora fragariae]|nr:hypothetical protein PF003_g37461 [Phytophthora fragariae]